MQVIMNKRTGDLGLAQPVCIVNSGDNLVDIPEHRDWAILSVELNNVFYGVQTSADNAFIMVPSQLMDRVEMLGEL